MSKRDRKKQPELGKTPPKKKAGGVAWIILGVLLFAGALVPWLGFFRHRGQEPAPARQNDLNLLLITLDTTRADYIGCYGRSAAETPNIDRLAAEGTRFERCAACTPQTLPSHCTIMTGTYPFVHGVRRNAVNRLGEASVTLAEMLGAAGFSTEAIVAAVVLNEMHGLSQGFDKYINVFAGKAVNPAAAERKADEIGADAIAELQRLAGAARSTTAPSQPPPRFFLWVHFYDPHYPYESKRVSDQDSPEAYADEITSVDVQIGRLMDELKTLGLDRRTLVVLVGDHGEGLGQHGESQHGYFVYETTQRVPLILWAPSVVPAQGLVSAQARTVDILPTTLDYLDLPEAQHAQGVSLRLLVEGAEEDLELAAYGESVLAHEEFGFSRLRTLTRGEWKYVHSSRPELYDLTQDPDELQNLAGRKPDLAAQMREELRGALASSPPEERTADMELSQADAERLESLGYVGSQGGADETATDELATFEPAGDNPADHAAAIELVVRGHRLMSLGQYAEAEPLLRQAVEAMPQAPRPLNELSRTLRKLGRDEEFFEVCRRVLDARPEAKQTWLIYARQLARTGRLEQAAEQLKLAAQRLPQDSEVHAELADALAALRRFDEARASYEQAVGSDPRNTLALLGFARLCEKQGKYDEAEKYLREALAVKPKWAVLQRELEQVQEARIKEQGG